jgi:hypothetical protein
MIGLVAALPSLSLGCRTHIFARTLKVLNDVHTHALSYRLQMHRFVKGDYKVSAIRGLKLFALGQAFLLAQAISDLVKAKRERTAGVHPSSTCTPQYSYFGLC